MDGMGYTLFPCLRSDTCPPARLEEAQILPIADLDGVDCRDVVFAWAEMLTSYAAYDDGDPVFDLDDGPVQVSPLAHTISSVRVETDTFGQGYRTGVYVQSVGGPDRRAFGLADQAAEHST